MAPVPYPQHSKFNPGVFDCRPINAALVTGDINADLAGVFAAVVRQETIFVDLEQRGIIGPFGHLLHHINFFPAKVKVVTGGFLRLFRFFREVRGIVWFLWLFGGLIFEFINTPNYRGNLCPGDVVLGLEEKLPIDLIPLEDAVVVENQGGKIFGVRKRRGIMGGAGEVQDIDDDLCDLKTVDGVIQPQAEARREKPVLLGQLIKSTGPMGTGGCLIAIAGGHKDQLQGLSQRHLPLGGEGGGGGAVDNVIVVEVFDISIVPVIWCHVSKVHFTRCGDRRGQRKNQGHKQEEGKNCVKNHIYC